MSQQLFILYEHAAGYALFSVKEYEEMSLLLGQVEVAVMDLAKFSSLVRLAAFAPFKTAVAALENINSISEGMVPQDLLVFLDDHFSKLKKKKCCLGIADSKLGAALTEAIGVQCNHLDAIPEIIRGIRFHFHKLVKGFTKQSAGVAQLGLGHSYSRAKVKFNVNRSDNMIIQSIALLDQLDKDVNTFSMRIREWYSYHFPELVKIVPDNYLYAKAAKFIKDRKQLTEEKLEELEEIVMDGSKAQAIIDAAKMSMGMDISPVDLMNIELFAERVVHLSEYRNKLANYLHQKMTCVAPNLQSLIGDQVGARLISHAGSLTNLAKFPASTVQILGAEKALFRAIKTRTNTPKFGLLYNSSFIGRAGLKNKGRISRFLANKCSIASRIDCFLEQPTSIFGDSLKEQVEERLKFYESGEVPRKNVHVMKEAIKALGAAVVEEKEEEEEKSPKKKQVMGPPMESLMMANSSSSAKKQNKKKKRKAGFEEEVVAVATNGTTNGGDADFTDDSDQTPKKKAKKSKKMKKSGGGDLDASMLTDMDSTLNTTSATVNDGESEGDEETVAVETGAAVGVNSEKKKKKKKKNKNNISMQSQ